MPDAAPVCRGVQFRDEFRVGFRNSELLAHERKAVSRQLRTAAEVAARDQKCRGLGRGAQLAEEAAPLAVLALLRQFKFQAERVSDRPPVAWREDSGGPEAWRIASLRETQHDQMPNRPPRFVAFAPDRDAFQIEIGLAVAGDQGGGGDAPERGPIYFRRLLQRRSHAADHVAGPLGMSGERLAVVEQLGKFREGTRQRRRFRVAAAQQVEHRAGFPPRAWRWAQFVVAVHDRLRQDRPVFGGPGHQGRGQADGQGHGGRGLLAAEQEMEDRLGSQVPLPAFSR